MDADLHSAAADAPPARGRGEVPLIELRSVTKTYRNSELSVEVLHGIDLDIHEGEFVAIMGASGSGKSTLMNILGCLDRPTTGTYRFMGRDVSQLGSDELALLRRDDFGFVFQSYNLIPTANAAENVEVPAMYSGLPPQERQALLKELGLEDRGHHRPNQLSGGQQQRVSILRALMNGGRIILADEPTGALDSKSSADVMRLLAELSRHGHTVLLITHAKEVADHADRRIELKDGHILSDPGPAPAAAHQQAFTRPVVARKGSRILDMLEAARMALRSLRANLFRAALTLLGIVIGVGSVIAMLAIGDGAKQEVIDRISAMGSNLLLVRPGAPNQRGFSGTATLVLSDVYAVDTLPNLLAAVPEQTSTAILRVSTSDTSTTVNGTSYKFPMARKWPVAKGSFFSEDDEGSYATVAVLGETVAKALFEDDEPAGSSCWSTTCCSRWSG